MQKLKSIIKKAVNRDILDVYKFINPTPNDFSFAIHCFSTLSVTKKYQISQSLSRKLQRELSNQQTLQLLILCDFLSATNPQVFQPFPTKMLSFLDQKRKLKGVSKQQKIKLAESNFNYFYLQYLRQKIWKCKSADNISVNNLQNGLNYSQTAITALKLTVQHDFIIQYALAHSQLNNQIKIALENILRRSTEDLAFLIRFIDKWSYIIVEDRPQSIFVNDIYEQLIYVSKNVGKLEYLNNKINGHMKFPRYQINKNLNSKIQKSMVEKDSQRRQFYSQKRLKTEGDINQQQAQITQSEICVKVQI